MARHPNRPYTLDYIEHILRNLKNLQAIALLLMIKRLLVAWAFRWSPSDGYRSSKRPCCKDKVSRNFGMPAPEGYRKALRLMEMAERLEYQCRCVTPG